MLLHTDNLSVIVPPSGTKASLLATKLGLSHLWSFNGRTLPVDSITGKFLLSDPNITAIRTEAQRAVGLSTNGGTINNPRLLIAGNPFSNTLTTYIFAFTIKKPGDTGWHVLTTTKNEGGDSSSNFTNQLAISYNAAQKRIAVTRGSTVPSSSTSLAVLEYGILNTVVCIAGNDIDSRLFANGKFFGTIPWPGTFYFGTNGIGGARYIGIIMGDAISLHALGIVRRAVSDDEAKFISRGVSPLFTKQRIYMPMVADATAYTHPTLSLATLVAAGGNTYQPRVTYTF